METYMDKSFNMKQAIFHNKRDIYDMATTLGIMYDPDGKQFEFTLEDICRPYGIKDRDHTAIPATEGDFTYKMDIRTSNKYGEHVVVYTDKEDLGNGVIKYTLEYGGIKFEYVLVHGGNDKGDTAGCILLAKTRNETGRSIQGTLKKEFTEEVKRLKEMEYDTRLRITNLPQAS